MTLLLLIIGGTDLRVLFSFNFRTEPLRSVGVVLGTEPLVSVELLFRTEPMLSVRIFLRTEPWLSVVETFRLSYGIVFILQMLVFV